MQGGGADGAEVTELLVLLADAVRLRQADPAAAVDRRLCSLLGRRLLDLLRTEVVRGWTKNGGADAQMPALLETIERVREVIELDWEPYFTSQLSGPDGLELLVEVAHDLRSPLTSILFLAETLQRGQSGPVNEVQRRQLGLIYGAALGLSSVASDVIELARGGDQLAEKEAVPFSVTALLGSVRDIVWPIAEEKRLVVRVLPPRADHRLGHPVALSRVLLNLTTNALKFTEEGYVEIVTRETSPARVEFAVRDSGRGIDPAVVNILYQPFRRSTGRRRLCFSDTGLGLTMCRRLVQAMDSELQVETRPGWGTRFFFEVDLPPCGPQ
ncbi:MAG: hypothetical protein AUH42_05585 [Gemmatimonadetes bacterium 13_1_40CM_70_11]|nr:MAG: hypothetical protein AUH42_05585 [Gemmatimonadetes bacterium 13_1_40CM_70_11]